MKRPLFALTVLFGLIPLGVLIAAGWLWYEMFGDRSRPISETSLIVARGSSGTQVANLLEQQGVIASPLAFRLLVRFKHAETKLEAGEYRFPAHVSAAEVLQQLVTSGVQVAVWVTIPEGFTAKEIAQTLATDRLDEEPTLEDYFLHDQLLVAPGQRTVNLEGFLFPDTYLMPVGATPAALAKIMTDQFMSELPNDAAARAKRLGYTIPQVVTVASLIEREAQVDDERRLMAGIYYHRLKLGMPLEVDATIEYTFAHHKDVITRADLARDTPYNTYLHLGLPPTPIANPGAASLRAAFDPQATPFLFYVYKGHGRHAFSRTLEEQNTNIAKYLQ